MLLMLLMIANVFYDVVMRYFFNNVSIGMQELEWHLFAAMFMFGIGYTLKENGHVRVDIFYETLSPRMQIYIDILSALVFALPITLIVAYYGYSYALDAYQLGEGSPDPGGLPYRWIIRSVVPLANVFLLICVVHSVIHNLAKLKTLSGQDQADMASATGTDTSRTD